MIMPINTRILLSVASIAAAGALVAGSTFAFFSDSETSNGNTFTAGKIDLQVDSTATYNGVTVAASTWPLKDLVPTADKFFNFTDIKPGDVGENTISLHVINNDAWVCAEVSNLASADNGITESEGPVDNDVTSGELDNTMVWTIWRDNGAGSGGVAGDNIQNGTEQTLASGNPVNGVLPVYDSTTGTGALVGGSTGYLGVKWELPSATGNEVQTDSLTGDISFTAVQSRNNANYRCVPPVITTINRTQQGFGDGGWAGWSCPANTTAVGGGIDSNTNPVGPNGLAVPSAIVGGFTYPVFPHYTFPAGETGYVVRDLPDGLGNTISFHVDCQAN